MTTPGATALTSTASPARSAPAPERPDGRGYHRGLSQAQTQAEVARGKFNRTERLLRAGIYSRQQWELDKAEVARRLMARVASHFTDAAKAYT